LASKKFGGHWTSTFICGAGKGGQQGREGRGGRAGRDTDRKWQQGRERGCSWVWCGEERHSAAGHVGVKGRAEHNRAGRRGEQQGVAGGSRAHQGREKRGSTA